MNIEREISLELEKAFEEIGIKSSREWSMKNGTQRLRVDFYIHYPTRAFIELKFPPPGSSLGVGALAQIRHYYYCFKKEVIPIFVAPKDLTQSVKSISGDLPICFIDLDPLDPLAPMKAAKNIRNKMVHCEYPFNKIGIWKSDYDFEKSKKGIQEIQKKVGELDNVLLSFAPLIDKENFKVLQEEISSFNIEFQTNHFTTAALRIGRTIEFIFYSLARAWGINLNKKSIKKIQQVKDLFNSFEKQIIDYNNIEYDDKKDYLKKLQDKSQQITIKIQNLIDNIDDNKIEETEVPINIYSILSDIKKHYKGDIDILEEVNLLDKEGLIRKVMKKRNSAAHADTSGNRREFNKEDLEDMINDMRSLLFRLCNIASIIQKNSRNITP